MREQEHKRQIEKLWQEKLAVYQAQREQEWEEKRVKDGEDDEQRQIVAAKKDELLKQHAHILNDFNPKAAS